MKYRIQGTCSTLPPCSVEYIWRVEWKIDSLRKHISIWNPFRYATLLFWIKITVHWWQRWILEVFFLWSTNYEAIFLFATALKLSLGPTQCPIHYSVCTRGLFQGKHRNKNLHHSQITSLAFFHGEDAEEEVKWSEVNVTFYLYYWH
jgi:hypothetical protein